MRRAGLRINRYELLLAAVISARATSFIFSKLALEAMDTFNLLAARCLLAFAVLAVLFFRRLRHIGRRTLLAGAAIGTAFFLCMSAELTALHTASSSSVSLLENCAIVFVPLIDALLLRRLPDKKTAASTIAAFLGVLCLALEQGGLSGGIFWGLAAALIYACAIILTARFSHESEDPLCIGVVQVGTMGVLALVASLLFESPVLPQTAPQCGMVAALALVCTCFGFTLQPLAQSRISAERAGVFCAINPAVASLLGVCVLHESIGALGLLGLVLILSAIAMPAVVRD